MLDETLQDLRESIEKAHEALRRDLAKIRTGRANPGILDGVRVDYYGTPTPLKQMAGINVPEARMITLKPFERSSINLIESAIRNAQLGLNPSSDGELIRIPIPPLTEERRRDLAKTARKEGEECKIAIRKARHDAKDMLDELEKSGDVGKDDAARALKDLEAIVKDGVTKVDDMVAKKEEDIMKV
ncbi:MAG: ribosome recycling factor [Sandaracinaceae bacterium]|jgi:ribosome recycling factor|nr:ribosome recycling factor [Sandaracinaceae bacterium]MBP7684745.1 ribosome recycling factor [Deltaproteobacteria bacterium]MBK6813834.1 ribosome recycling factor [Sandaracinaceae bacterium]MBK7154658.1 ribosome recycling factor [Sandaracinaceae bacterium]MBK7776958.1 ribosome recycling factor [Sandaracinaceae bacterium]